MTSELRQSKVPIKKKNTVSTRKLRIKNKSNRDTFSTALLKITGDLGRNYNLKQVISKILRSILKELQANKGSIMLLDKTGESLRILSAVGLPRSVMRKGEVRDKKSISFWVIKNKRSLMLQGRVQDRRFNSPAKRRKIWTALSVPLKAENKIIGVVNVSRDSGKKFNQSDLNKMTILAGQAALAIENARLFEENLQTIRLATIGKVVSAISHEIKNILTGIKGGIWLFSETVKQRGDTVLESQCELMRRNINRLSLLTLDMLDFCKKREPLLNECDLNAICQEAVDTIKLAKQQKKYEVQIEIDKELHNVWLDEERMLRCLINLIDNAVDALPEEGGKVKITSKMVEYASGKLFMGYRFSGAKRLIVLEISDTGQGISKYDLPFIFEPFYSTKQTRGTGLGLSVSKKIVEEHKGKIFCESEVGKGTTFRLVIPQYQ